MSDEKPKAPIGVFICRRGQRVPRCSTPGCTNEADFACDFVIGRKPDGTPKTCDRKLCGRCTTKRGDEDLCQPHSKMRVTVQG